MDAINPDHYKRLPAEAIEIIESAIDNAPSNQAALLHGQVLKYILRCWSKNGIEDLKKSKWYLDRLIEHCDESPIDLKQGLVKAWACENGKAKQVYPEPINSDTIPEGYRKLGDSLMEQRQLGDLRWSIIEEGYIPISGDEIVCANRDNWAACRKITWEVTGEVTGEVKPPDGWRWLEVGEVIRKGDKYRDLKSETWIECVVAVGDSLQGFHKPTIRRNRFEVGEKVVRVFNGVVYKVIRILSMGYQLESEFRAEVILHGKDLAPYIEDAK